MVVGDEAVRMARTGLLLSTATPVGKRKLGDTEFEIADSEDEDYGWDGDDDELPPNPSQWQGSEDLLLKPVGSDDVGDGDGVGSEGGDGGEGLDGES